MGTGDTAPALATLWFLQPTVKAPCWGFQWGAAEGRAERLERAERPGRTRSSRRGWTAKQQQSRPQESKNAWRSPASSDTAATFQHYTDQAQAKSGRPGAKGWLHSGLVEREVGQMHCGRLGLDLPVRRPWGEADFQDWVWRKIHQGHLPPTDAS
jgi:hypothetical protein